MVDHESPWGRGRGNKKNRSVQEFTKTLAMIWIPLEQGTGIIGELSCSSRARRP